MKFHWFLIVSLSLVACGKKDALTTPRQQKSSWSQEDIAAFIDGCTTDLEPSLADGSRAKAICTCWISDISVYSIEQLRSGDAKIQAASNASFKACAQKSGENLNFARAALRWPAAEKKPLPNVLQKTLHRVKEKNPPKTHSSPEASAMKPEVPKPAPMETERPVAPIPPPIVLPKLGAEFSMTGYRLTKEGQFELNGDDRKSVFSDGEIDCTISIGKSIFQDKETKFLLVQAKNRAGETFTLSIQPFDETNGFYARKGKPSTFDQEVFTVTTAFGALVLLNKGSDLDESKASYCEIKDLKIHEGILKANVKATKMSGINQQATGRDKLAYGDVNGQFTCKVKDISVDGKPAEMKTAETATPLQPLPAPVKKDADKFFKAAEHRLTAIQSIQSLLEVNDSELSKFGSISMTRTELRKLKDQAEETGSKAFKDLEESSTDQADKDALRTKIENLVSGIQQKILKQYLRAQQGPG